MASRNVVTRVAKYTADELYNYDQAAEVIGVSRGALSLATSSGILTAVRMPHEIRKYVLRLEVDAVAGMGQVTSKEARAKIEMARRKSGHSEDLPSTDSFRTVVRSELMDALPAALHNEDFLANLANKLAQVMKSLITGEVEKQLSNMEISVKKVGTR